MSTKNREQRPKPSHSARERTILQARILVQGQRVLYVSNRPAGRLRVTLERELGIALESCGVKSRKLRSAAQRVRHGQYGVVVVATGFVSHAATDILGRAATSAGVWFVMAGRGRLLTVARAIVRERGGR